MMKYDPKIHNRQSIRLRGYDYSQSGLYFITMVVQHRLHLFGKIKNNEMRGRKIFRPYGNQYHRQKPLVR